jgi:hypothetical protein
MTTNKLLKAALAVAAIFTTSGAASSADLSDQDIRNGFKEHAAKAQFYRWYQYYERSDGGIENAIDILSPDVRVKSTLGEVKGTDAYRERVAQLPTTWKNAHFVNNVAITIEDDGSISLNAKITYLNEGANEDGSLRAADLNYTTKLASSDTLLPKFSSIEIDLDKMSDQTEYKDAYAKNRALSVVHYWLAIIEDPARDPEPAKEILADGFALNFSSGAITDFDGLKAWLTGPAASVSASSHSLKSFSANSDNDQEITLTVGFDWQGILPDGTRLEAETLHNWTLTNDITERFARIKSVDVEIIKPFQPILK